MRLNPRAWRRAAAILAGYLLDALITWATESALRQSYQGADYYALDIIIQALNTCASAIFACMLAGHSRLIAVGLVTIALPVGLVSLIVSWRQQPHWYGVALWLTFPPSAFLGVAAWKAIRGGNCSEDRLR